MKGLNEVKLIGNLGAEVNFAAGVDGKVSRATLRIATNDTWTDASGQKHERVEWHNIVAFRGLADIAGRYLRKGAKIYISGSLRTRQYEADGITKWFTEVVARDMLMLDKRGAVTHPGDDYDYHDAPEAQAPRTAATSPDHDPGPMAVAASQETEDDVPF